jgi:hypothetical protein
MLARRFFADAGPPQPLLPPPLEPVVEPQLLEPVVAIRTPLLRAPVIRGELCSGSVFCGMDAGQMGTLLLGWLLEMIRFGCLTFLLYVTQNIE